MSGMITISTFVVGSSLHPPTRPMTTARTTNQEEQGRAGTTASDDDDRLLQSLVSAATCAWEMKMSTDPTAATAEDGIGNDDAAHSQRDVEASHRVSLDSHVLEELRFHARRLVPGRWQSPNEGGGEADDDSDDNVAELVTLAVDVARQRLPRRNDEAVRDDDRAQPSQPGAKKQKAGAAPASFSLLDQFNAQLLGVGGLGLVTPEQILEAETLTDQLALLQQVQELVEDDWFFEGGGGDGESDGTSAWEQVLAVIRRGITESDPTSGDVGVAMDYAQLLIKWVDMAGNAYGGGGGMVGVLQLDLVQLAIDVMAIPANDPPLNDSPSDGYPPTRSSADYSGPPPVKDDSPSRQVERNIMTALLRCVWRTWMDWMMLFESRIGAGDEERVHAIGSKLWTVTSRPGPNRSSLLPSIIASLDPCALWFSSWMSLRAGYPSKDLLDVLITDRGSVSGGGDGIEKLRERPSECYSEGNSASPLALAWRQLVSLEADLEAGNGDVPVLSCYWLSAIHALLAHLRVSLFPWRCLMGHATGDNAASLTRDEEEGGTMSWLLKVYLAVLHRLHLSTQQSVHGGDGDVDRGLLERAATWKVRMQECCLDAIRILLSGCRNRGWHPNMVRLVRGAASAVDANPKLQVIVLSL